MTVAKFGECSLSVRGHSGYAEAGQDIVCAAVSAYVFQLAQVVIDSQREGAQIRLDPGEADIVCPGMEEAFSYCRTGFELLSKKYPDFVRVEG